MISDSVNLSTTTDQQVHQIAMQGALFDCPLAHCRRRARTKARNLPLARTMNQFANLSISESSTDICTAASKYFGRICSSLTAQTVPTIVRTSYLEPVSHAVAAQLSLDLFACSDKDFMSLFAASGAVMALEAKRDVLARRVTGLVKCKNEFQELSRCL